MNTEESLVKTLELVFSSKRSAPAHFSSYRDRSQSFGIDFEPLTSDVDYDLASFSWWFFHDHIPKEHRDALRGGACLPLMCGEDIMVGAFIITKLGAGNLVNELKQAIVERNVQNSKQKNPRELLKYDCVEKYFDACAIFGINYAQKDRKNT